MFTPEAGYWAGLIFIVLAICVVIASLRDRRARRRKSNRPEPDVQPLSASEQREDDGEPR
ncbi:hypothetical protein GA0004736_0041 [Curtobacterium sp. 9128]|uniref:hypothetical protein n=1 Tax=Curtobacterium sp. 9128 TaxID=1793722 RepID=UPI0007D71C53|nr:hypothetical protein [Curtobacterium sp. 9128]SBN61159.1 hypothetical protein GA0004736_0041 [Curtobacterium sp. 9128]